MRKSATFPLHRHEGRRTAEVWTTMVTGLPASLPADAAYRGSGRQVRREARRFLSLSGPRPRDGAARTAPAVWEIIALRRKAAAVGWPDSWPARPLPGSEARVAIVSDRVLTRLLSGAPPDGDTWPESLYPRLARTFREEGAAIRREFESLVALAEGSEIRGWLWESFLMDAYAWSVGQALAIDDAFAAIFVYLPGLDLLRSRLEGRRTNRELVTLLEINEALELYVRWLDGLLGELLETGPGWQVVLIGDPGLQATSEVEGFLVVSGPNARVGCVGDPILTLDATPIVLELTGFPVSREMAGGPPDYCLADPGARDLSVATFGRRLSAGKPVRP